MKRMNAQELSKLSPKLHEIQLDLLLKLDSICREHNIKYYLAYGSCLGSIRHKGFIPWDHDIDVLMSIDDVERFEKYANDGKYKLLTWKNGSGFNSIAPWYVNTNTTCVIKENIGLNIDQAVAIDIYPFYNAPKSKAKLKANILRAHLYTLLVLGMPPHNHGRIGKIIGKIVLGFYGKRRISKALKLEKKLRDVPYSGYILDYCGEDISLFNAIVYPFEWFAEPIELKFEGYNVLGPANPRRYLKKRYGNYMKLPPKEKQVASFDNCLYLDVTKGYHGKWNMSID